MFIWVTLPDHVDAAQVLLRAVERDVAFVPGAPFFAGTPQHQTLRLSFITYRPEMIVEGMRRLSAVFAEVAEQ